jgi:hypothetical protein
MSYDYTRTVSITPVSTSYSWDATPNWITITRVSVNSDDWTITLQENTGDARSATLTVRHANSTTVDTITVNQAEGVGVPDPTATPVPTSVPTATPAPTNVPNPTPVPPTATPVPPTATPVPTVQPTPGPNPTFTFATNTTSGNRFIFAPSSLNTDVSYTIVADGNTSPAAPSNFSTNGVSGSNQTGPTVTNNSNVFTGTYRFTKTFSPIADLNVNCTVSAPYGTSDTWYCTLEADSGPKNTATPSPTNSSGSGSGSGPTATPIPNPTATPVPSSTPSYSGGGGGGGCHVAGELLTLANGETKLVEDVVVGDNLLSVNFDGFSLDGEWKSWKRREETLGSVYTNTTVTNVTVLEFDKYYDFNNGLLKITEEHPVLVKDTVGDIYFKQVRDIVNSDWLLNEDNEWVDITSIELIAVPERFTTYSFNVEEADVYFANGIIVHNVENLEEDREKQFMQ